MVHEQTGQNGGPPRLRRDHPAAEVRRRQLHPIDGDVATDTTRAEADENGGVGGADQAEHGRGKPVAIVKLTLRESARRLGVGVRPPYNFRHVDRASI
jgi:hypothetical protein